MRRTTSSTATAQSPAKTSSSMMPKPDGRRRSHRPAGNGLSWSKRRNSRKAATSPGTVVGAPRQVIVMPATSSMTTNWGSFCPVACETRDAAQMPTSVMRAAQAASVTLPNGRMSRHRGRAPADPAVPGAMGTRPQPNQVLSQKATGSEARAFCQVVDADLGITMKTARYCGGAVGGNPGGIGCRRLGACAEIDRVATWIRRSNESALQFGSGSRFAG